MRRGGAPARGVGSARGGGGAPGSAAHGDGELPDYATFEGHRHLVALNHDHPGVADHVVAVMRHWLSRGVAGWRLDAAYAVPRAFWSKVLPRVRADFPDAYFFGEVIHGDYAGFVRETGVDAVFVQDLGLVRLIGGDRFQGGKACWAGDGPEIGGFAGPVQVHKR